MKHLLLTLLLLSCKSQYQCSFSGEQYQKDGQRWQIIGCCDGQEEVLGDAIQGQDAYHHGNHCGECGVSCFPKPCICQWVDYSSGTVLKCKCKN